MFAADLSWADPRAEKVGERRERKAREKELSIASTGTPSIRSGKSSRSFKPASANETHPWWPLKRSKTSKTVGRTKAESETSPTRANVPPRLASISAPLQTPRLDTPILRNIQPRGPLTQLPRTYSLSLSPRLPSNAPLGAPPPSYQTPELDADASSRGTVDSAVSRSSNERRWGWKAPERIQIIDEVQQVQQLSPHSYVARTTLLSSEEADPSPPTTSSGQSIKRKKKKLYSVRVEGPLDLEALRLQDQLLREQHPEEFGPPPQLERPQLQKDEEDKELSYASGLQDRDLVAWRPPSEWDIIYPDPQSTMLVVEQHDNPKGVPSVRDYSRTPSLGEVSVQIEDEKEVFNDSSESQVSREYDHGEGQTSPFRSPHLTRFQGFIRRMASANPRIILDRLKEDWTNPLDAQVSDEMRLEKQLWVLTAFQLENLGRYSRFPKADTGRILELYGDLAEAFQLSAMYPRQQVHFLSTHHLPSIPVPSNVSHQHIPSAGSIPLPYPSATFSHIRTSTLPSLVPSATLPALLAECHRLLAPGGMLEIRIMDAAPVRGTAGPLLTAWMEERVATNLERASRCSKPCTLVPRWVSDAGFDLPAMVEGEENVRVRGAVEEGRGDVAGELEILVGRELWRGIWGDFVSKEEGQGEGKRWWWDDENIVRECRERGTVWECGAIFAFKK